MKTITVLLALLISSGSTAAEWKKLDGIYAITSEYYLDSSLKDSKDSHYRVQLKGESAKDLYLAIKTKEYVDDCTGAKAKNVGEMQCLLYEGTGKYECHFSLNLLKNKIEYGVAC